MYFQRDELELVIIMHKAVTLRGGPPRLKAVVFFCAKKGENMNQNVNRYLGEEKVGKLMVKFSIPCVMSLLIAALYNMVDQIFIGRGVGYLGNGATNVVFPITVIALALTLMIGDGCAAFLSLCQGRGDSEGANKCVGSSITAVVVLGVVLTALFALLREQILWSFGATENNVDYAREYFKYLLPGFPFFMFGNAVNCIIRADGDPKFAMLSTLAGCVINLVFDPIAIFVLHCGMMGAALATVAGQVVTAILGIWYLTRPKSFRLKKSSFIPSGSAVKRIIPLGGSSFLTQIAIVVIMAAMNNILVAYGAQSKYGADIPMTVVGIVMKVFQLVISVVVGIAAGCQPIVGYNYGAGRFDRVREIFAKMMRAEICVGALGVFLFECFPLQIIGIFGSGDALYQEYAVLTFRIFLCTIIFCCVQKSCSIFLQSLGKPVLSTFLSLLRDFILSVPLILLLPLRFGVVGPLLSAPVADVVAFVVTVFAMRRVMKQLSAGEYLEADAVECEALYD
jgi:putative MATE family efflux protein